MPSVPTGLTLASRLSGWLNQFRGIANMEGGTQDDLMIGTSKRNGFLGRSLLLAFLLAKTLAFPSSNISYYHCHKALDTTFLIKASF